MTQQAPPQNSVLGSGLNAPMCLSSTWNLCEFLDMYSLGLNVNLKDQDCEVRNIELSYVLVSGAKLRYAMRIRSGE